MVGLGWAKRNSPLAASLGMSFHPIERRGQPSFLAVRSGIAITCGDWTIDGLSSGTHSFRTWALSSRPQSDDAGPQTTGLSVPAAIIRSASPDVTARPVRRIERPWTLTAAPLKRSMSGTRSCSVSGE